MMPARPVVEDDEGPTPERGDHDWLQPFDQDIEEILAEEGTRAAANTATNAAAAGDIDDWLRPFDQDEEERAAAAEMLCVLAGKTEERSDRSRIPTFQPYQRHHVFR